MNNRFIGGYRRLNKTSARKAFENGEKLYVMSIDRNPVNSPSTAYIYYIGCKSLCEYDINKSHISTFDDLLSDFSEWLYTDGYGHMPDKYRSRNFLFSYWLKVV